MSGLIPSARFLGPGDFSASTHVSRTAAVTARSSTLTIRPSSMCAIRSPKWKTRLSCVTTRTARSGRTAAVAHQLHHGLAGLVIERGGRLIADDEAGFVHRARAIATRCC